MTNGEKMQADFPDIEMWGESKDTLDYSLGGMIHRVMKSWWNAEYKEPTTKNDLEIVMDAMEYRTNALIENIKSEIMHFANAHCSGDDINIYDVFKVIDDCCKAENLTTKNDLGVKLISKEDALDCVNWGYSFSDIYKKISDLPLVTPIKPKGYWIEEFNDIEGEVRFTCSNCRKYQLFGTDFCYHCGSDNREVEK